MWSHSLGWPGEPRGLLPLGASIIFLHFEATSPDRDGPKPWNIPMLSCTDRYSVFYMDMDSKLRLTRI